DKKKIKDVLKNDPFVREHKEWRKALELMQKMGQRAEQQALAAWGLNYVMNKYLPDKIKETKTFLP
ncbi:DNA topoisomerase VI, partial [Candidatus Woesearchaeota archaeon]|nr:DNA topoisomerase VI [Candidatus Woesearchaeota archaeon]